MEDMKTSLKAMEAAMVLAVNEGTALRERIEADYLAKAIPADKFGEIRGPVHAASLLAWNRIADHCGVPRIDAEVIAVIPMKAAWNSIDEPQSLSEEENFLLKTAFDWCEHGRFWRTELCSGEGVKYCLGKDGSFPPPEYLRFSLDDCRIMDMHWGMPDIKVIGRPTIEPARVKGWPVEFRVFCGGGAETGAVSFYYPQAGDFEVTPELERAMSYAREYGVAMHDARTALGLTPWLPEMGEPDDRIGSTIDFMLKSDGDLVMVDAGPGFGCGAHPCCFIDVPIEGERWKLADGVELR